MNSIGRDQKCGHTEERPGYRICAQREEPLLVQGAFEGAAQIEEIVVAPHRREQDERGGVFQQRAGLAIPRETIGQPALHNVDAIDEAVLRFEIGADADELGVVAVRVTGAVEQRRVPQHSASNARCRAIISP